MARPHLSFMLFMDLIGPLQAGEIKYALDLGCGIGVDSKYLASLGYIVTAVDSSTDFAGATIQDIRDFPIEEHKYSVIICRNVLAFIQDKHAIKKLLARIASGIAPKGAAYINFYGHNHNMKEKHPDNSFFEYAEALSLIEALPLEIIEKTISEGFMKNYKKEWVYQHTFNFIVRAKAR